MINWQVEWPLIKEAASKFGLNPYFIAAIRKTENGGPGREFGVLSTPAPTYADQLRVCCVTVAHRMSLYRGTANDRVGKVSIMSREFVRWFAQLWAPAEVENDPTNLNANWYTNCMAEQERFAANGEPG